VPAYRKLRAAARRAGFRGARAAHLYQKEDYYRTLARKAQPVGLTHWSVILRHHQQCWPGWPRCRRSIRKRIGFYGLSFGGESAMRLPSLLDGYALSICSGDFNAWTRQGRLHARRKSFMFSDEWKSPASTWAAPSATPS